MRSVKPDGATGAPCGPVLRKEGVDPSTLRLSPISQSPGVDDRRSFSFLRRIDTPYKKIHENASDQSG
jgi:hypothetical protein